MRSRRKKTSNKTDKNQNEVIKMAVKELNSENYSALVEQNEKPVLIDFFATWCGPCKMLSPIVDEVAEENADSLTVCKVDVDNSPELAAKFGISVIPTLIVMKDGKQTANSVGYISKEKILELIF